MEQVNKFGQALFYLQEYYLDTLNSAQMTDNALAALIEQLDPHSAFIPAKDVEAMNEPLQGNFDGIGVEFSVLHDSLVVVLPVAGGPSEMVGIRAEDRIVQVDGVDISGPSLDNTKVYSLLRGPKGTRVKLTVKRRNTTEPLHFEVVRDRIPINSIDASYEVEDGIMYVKISRFALTTMEEFIAVFEHLTDMPKGLILDLEDNGGGYLGSALFLAEQFLEKGNLMLYTEGAHTPRRDEFSSGNGFFTKTPVVVMINENSASASEIVAGALQDWDRGVIVGRRSFGKGLVQQALPLNDGSEIRLTIARYHTPSGRVIQTPYKMGDKTSYYRDFYERYSNGELYNADSINIPDSLVFKTMKKQRTVYGGGGIVPDIFVPADTTYYSDFFSELLQRGLITEYMNDYLDIHRAKLQEQFPTFEAFDAGVSLQDVPFEDLLAKAREKGVIPEEGALERSETMMRIQLKALMARRLFDTSGFYRVFNPASPSYLKAVEEIKKLVR